MTLSSDCVEGIPFTCIKNSPCFNRLIEIQYIYGNKLVLKQTFSVLYYLIYIKNVSSGSHGSRNSLEFLVAHVKLV